MEIMKETTPGDMEDQEINEEKLTPEMLQLITGGEQENQDAEAFMKEMVQKYQVEKQIHLVGKMTKAKWDQVLELLQAGK